MEEQDNQLRTEFKGQTWTRPERSANWQDKGGAKGKSPLCLGIERGNRFVRRFKLLFKDGGTISVPYAFLPVIIHEPGKGLRIRTGEVEITIKGRGLNVLADHLNEEKVLWIKESGSGTDTGGEEVFVSDIDVEGELLE